MQAAKAPMSDADYAKTMKDINPTFQSLTRDNSSMNHAQGEKDAQKLSDLFKDVQAYWEAKKTDRCRRVFEGGRRRRRRDGQGVRVDGHDDTDDRPAEAVRVVHRLPHGAPRQAAGRQLQDQVAVGRRLRLTSMIRKIASMISTMVPPAARFR